MSQRPQSQPLPPELPPLQPQRPPGPPVNTRADIGFILSLVSVVIFCFWPVAVPLALAGLVLSLMGMARAPTIGTGMFAGVAGFILANFTLLVTTPLMLMVPFSGR
jgi:hypothetical protein